MDASAESTRSKAEETAPLADVAEGLANEAVARASFSKSGLGLLNALLIHEGDKTPPVVAELKAFPPSNLGGMLFYRLNHDLKPHHQLAEEADPPLAVRA